MIAAVQASAKILPESCGSDQVKFDVKVKTPPDGKPSPDITPPAPGKAQIIFIETMNSEGLHLTTPTTRFGVDGAWVGANKGNSRFAVDVTPGEHNVCVNWQSNFDDQSDKFGLDTFTAEAGKIYYYEVKIMRFSEGVGTHMDFLFDLKQLSGIEGRYRTKISGESTSKSHIVDLSTSNTDVSDE